MTKSFSKTIREARITGGITIRELAEASNLSHSYVSEIEKGRKHPPLPATVEAFAPMLADEELDKVVRGNASRLLGLDR